MREAIGSSLTLYLFIPIIILIIFFVSFIINYASAYRAANYVVSEIENCQGMMNDCGSTDKLHEITEKVAKEYNYLTPGRTNIVPTCIQNGSGAVFRVQLPVNFELPIFGSITAINVKAETKTIPNTTC